MLATLELLATDGWSALAGAPAELGGQGRLGRLGGLGGEAVVQAANHADPVTQALG